MKTPMTQEQKRIAIAEACPGLFEKLGDDWCYKVSKGVYATGDPFTSLDAMHEAEKVLLHGKDAGDKWNRYTDLLTDATGIDFEAHASAAQRAEAFGRTLKLWE